MIIATKPAVENQNGGYRNRMAPERTRARASSVLSSSGIQTGPISGWLAGAVSASRLSAESCAYYFPSERSLAIGVSRVPYGNAADQARSHSEHLHRAHAQLRCKRCGEKFEEPRELEQHGLADVTCSRKVSPLWESAVISEDRLRALSSTLRRCRGSSHEKWIKLWQFLFGDEAVAPSPRK